MASFFQNPTYYAIGAIAAASAFTGVGIHCSSADAYTWSSVSPSVGVNLFQMIFPRVMKAQIVTLVLSILDGSTAAFFSQGLARKFFLAGVFVNALVFPFTLLAMGPINKVLLDTKPAQADMTVTELFQQWGNRNWVRPALTTVSACLFAAGLFNLESK
jgi:hypothetical protein